MSAGSIEYALSVFLSYHKGNRQVADLLVKELRAQLSAPLDEVHLTGFEPKQPDIEVWYDEELLGGDRWDATIQLKLEQADVVLFLVTEASLDATYMWAEELPVAVRRMADGARVVALTYNRAAAPILTQLETKNCQRLPETTVDRLGEAAWLSQVAKGVRRIVQNSLLQVTPTPSRRRSSAIAASRNAIADTYEVLPRSEGAVIGGLPLREISRTLDMCELALGLNDPHELERSLHPCRERLADLRVKLASAAPNIAAKLRDIVHELEAVQTWIRDERAEPIVSRLAVSPSNWSADSRADIEELNAEIASIKNTVTSLSRAPQPTSVTEHAAREIVVDQIGRHAGITSHLLDERAPDLGAVVGQLAAIDDERAAFQTVVENLGSRASTHSIQASGTILFHTNRAHQWTSRIVARSSGGTNLGRRDSVDPSASTPDQSAVEEERVAVADPADPPSELEDDDAKAPFPANVEIAPNPDFPTRSGMFFDDALAMQFNGDEVRISSTKRGFLMEEPSVVAYVTEGGRKVVHAVGAEAKNMLGKTHRTMEVVRPIRDGTIADFDVAEEMIKQFIKKVGTRRELQRPRIVMSIPAGATPVERRAIRESAQAADAREVHLIEESIAAAVGVGLQITSGDGRMMVDVGGGTTEIGVISRGGVVWSRSVRVAGHKMDEAIIQYLRRTENLLIGDSTAERIKKEIGTAKAPDEGPGLTLMIKGRDNIVGTPKEVAVTEAMIAQALADPVAEIVYAVRQSLDHMPPELGADIRDGGIHLLGESALLRGLGELLSETTGCKVFVHPHNLSVLAGLHVLALDKQLCNRVSMPEV